MKQISRLLTTLLLLPVFSIAQSNYKPGSVVNLKGDTIRGFIDYRGWDSNPGEISFKSSLGDGESKKFGLNDITFFKIDGYAAYKKYTCSISMDETNTNRLGSGKDTTTRTDVIFLKILQFGRNVALYSYTDALKTRYYISETPDYKPTELVYKIYDNNGGTGIDNTYQKQLFALATKFNVLDDGLIRTIQNAEYNSPDLISIVSKINKISKEEYKSQYSDPTKLEFYAGAGVNFTSYKSGNQSPYSSGGGPGTNSVGGELLIGLNIIPNPKDDHFEIRAELSVAQSKFSSHYQLSVSPYGQAVASLNEVDLAFEPSFIYNFYRRDNLKIYLGAGVAVADGSFSSPFFSTNSNVNVASTDNTGAYNYDYVHFNTTEIIKGGFKIVNKYEIFANYLFNDPVTGGGYFALNNNHLQAGFIYHFGK